jgi:hypothetical protein
MIKSAHVNMNPQTDNTNYWTYTVSLRDENGVEVAREQGEQKKVSEVWRVIGGLLYTKAPHLSASNCTARITEVCDGPKHVTDVEDMSREDLVDMLVSVRYEENFDDHLRNMLGSIYNKGYANGYKTGEEETREDERMRRDKAIIRGDAEQDQRDRAMRRKLLIALDDMTEALRILG